MTRPHLLHPGRTLKETAAKWAAGISLAAGLIGSAISCQQAAPAVRPLAVEQIPANSFKVKQYALVPMEGDKPTDVFVRENLVIVYTQRRLAYVYDRESLALKWLAKVTGEGTRVRPPVVLKNYVVFPTISSLEVFDPFGKNRRSVSTRGIALRSGAVGTGTHVIFGGDAPGGGRLENIDLAGTQYQSASPHWELSTRGGISSAPAVNGSFCYVGDDEGGVYAVNESTRKPIWAVHEQGREPDVFHAGGPIRADVKADGGGVYVASMDTRLYCLGSTDGRIQWRYFGGTPLLHTPEITAASVYILVDGTGVVSIDKAKGEAVRAPRYAVREAVGFLAEDEKFAFMESGDHGILAVDVKTGDLRFKSKRRDYVAIALSSSGNTLYTITADGTLRATVPVLTAGGVGELAMLGGNIEMQPVMASTH